MEFSTADIPGIVQQVRLLLSSAGWLTLAALIAVLVLGILAWRSPEIIKVVLEHRRNVQKLDVKAKVAEAKIEKAKAKKRASAERKKGGK